MPLDEQRREYRQQPLREQDFADDPLTQFRRWFEEARQADVPNPTAMTLATASADGQPSARVVLLKDIADRGLVFFSHADSPKGRDLAENPRAALVFLWGGVDRQVRVEGAVEQMPRAYAADYFHRRPQNSQVAAHVSRQSRVLEDRADLMRRFAEAQAEFADREVPVPDSWTGYLVVPERMEFWHGRPDRLNERLRYRREGEQWVLERLQP